MNTGTMPSDHLAYRPKTVQGYSRRLPRVCLHVEPRPSMQYLRLGECDAAHLLQHVAKLESLILGIRSDPSDLTWPAGRRRHAVPGAEQGDGRLDRFGGRPHRHGQIPVRGATAAHVRHRHGNHQVSLPPPAITSPSLRHRRHHLTLMTSPPLCHI